jgi:hypothetical protein
MADNGERKKQNYLGNAGVTAGSIALGTPVSMATGLGIGKVVPGLVERMKSTTNSAATDATVKATMEGMGGAHVRGTRTPHANTKNLDFTHGSPLANAEHLNYADFVLNRDDASPAMFHGKNFLDGKPRVGMGAVHSNDVLMHELGHELASRSKLNTNRLKELVGKPGVGHGLAAAGLAAGMDDDTRKYMPVMTEVIPLATFADEMSANLHASHQVYKHQGIGGAAKMLKNIVPGNALSYAAEAAPRIIGGYAGIAAMEKIRDVYRNHQEKQASQGNKYLEKIAADISALMPSTRKVTKGASAAMSRQGAYTRSMEHMPTHLAKAAEEQDSPHYVRNAAIGAGLGATASVVNPVGVVAYLRHGYHSARGKPVNEAIAAGIRADVLKKLILPGAAIGAAGAAGLTGLNQLRKQAGFITGAIDNVAAAAKGAGDIIKSTHGDLLGSKVHTHAIDKLGIRGDKPAISALHKEVSEGGDDVFYNKLHDPKDQEELTRLINRRKAARFVAGAVGAKYVHHQITKPIQHPGANDGYMYPN